VLGIYDGLHKNLGANYRPPCRTVGGCLRLEIGQKTRRLRLTTDKGESKMTIEKMQHNGAYVLSELVGEGAGEYLFTRTYYGYTLGEAKAQFKIAVEGE